MRRREGKKKKNIEKKKPWVRGSEKKKWRVGREGEEENQKKKKRGRRTREEEKKNVEKSWESQGAGVFLFGGGLGLRSGSDGEETRMAATSPYFPGTYRRPEGQPSLA